MADPTVLISYNDSPAVRDLFPGWDAAPLSWAYGMNAAKASSELLLASFLSVVRAVSPLGLHSSAQHRRSDTQAARPERGSSSCRCWRGA